MSFAFYHQYLTMHVAERLHYHRSMWAAQKTYMCDMSSNWKQLFVIVQNPLFSWDHCQQPLVKPCRWCDWCHEAWNVVKGGCKRFNYIFMCRSHSPINGKMWKNKMQKMFEKHHTLLVKLGHSYKMCCIWEIKQPTYTLMRILP